MGGEETSATDMGAGEGFTLRWVFTWTRTGTRGPGLLVPGWLARFMGEKPAWAGVLRGGGRAVMFSTGYSRPVVEEQRKGRWGVLSALTLVRLERDVAADGGAVTDVFIPGWGPDEAGGLGFLQGAKVRCHTSSAMLARESLGRLLPEFSGLMPGVLPVDMPGRHGGAWPERLASSELSPSAALPSRRWPFLALLEGYATDPFGDGSLATIDLGDGELGLLFEAKAGGMDSLVLLTGKNVTGRRVACLRAAADASGAGDSFFIMSTCDDAEAERFAAAGGVVFR